MRKLNSLERRVKRLQDRRATTGDQSKNELDCVAWRDLVHWATTVYRYGGWEKAVNAESAVTTECRVDPYWIVHRFAGMTRFAGSDYGSITRQKSFMIRLIAEFVCELLTQGLSDDDVAQQEYGLKFLDGWDKGVEEFGKISQ